MTEILIVDDERDFIDTLADRMRIRGMDVQTATSPKTALKLVEEKNFDAIVLDLLMPEMDGLETLRILKEKHPELQIILVTGHATAEKGIEAIRLGAADLIEKPTDLSILTEKIRKTQANKMILVEKKSEEKIHNIMMNKQ